MENLTENKDTPKMGSGACDMCGTLISPDYQYDVCPSCCGILPESLKKPVSRILTSEDALTRKKTEAANFG